MHKINIGFMRGFLFMVALSMSSLVFGQKGYYSAPVKIPLYLSASFAELRSNHFHSGIDIKTQGVTGIPVFSVADGFISRISISPVGFGNALYIDHYNGTTSVYGHLSEFREDIQEYIRKIQYEKHTFNIDVSVSPELFLVNKNEGVAKSGNSGSSGGPHLHFEIRDTKSEEPINPLRYGFEIADNISPKIFALLVEPLSESSKVNFQNSKKKYPIVFYDGKYHIQNNPVIPVFGKIGFAVEANDYFNNSGNKCGINSKQLKIDGELRFSVQLNRFSFYESKYINSYIDYEEFIKHGNLFQKTWIDPGNNFKNYEFSKERGVFEVPNDGSIHFVEIEIKDAYENTSILEFAVEGKSKDLIWVTPDFADYFDFDKENKWINDDIQLEIPKGSLYNSFGFQYGKLPATNGYYSDIYQIHNNTIPLHKNANLKIKSLNIEKRQESKALVVIIDEKTGKFWSLGGKYEDGWTKTNIRTLGTFAVKLDTISPLIKPLSISNKNSLTESNRIRFIISDELSGIEKIEGTIDGKWALFEYDAKNSLITHYFDNKRFELKKRHNFKLTVTDYKNNITTYEATFWK